MRKLFTLLATFFILTCFTFAQSPQGSDVSLNGTVEIPDGVGALTDTDPYDILIIEDPTGSPAVIETIDFNYNAGAGNSEAYSTLKYDTDYSWAVLADGYVYTDYATYQGDALYGEYLFSTVSGPELVSPANSLSGVSVKPEFKWIDDGVSTEYKVQIATSTDFVNDLVCDSVGLTADTVKFFGYNNSEIPLNNNTKYYWRVVATNGGSDYASDAWYFTTVDDINISLWNPGDGLEVYQYDPLLFSWGLNQATGSLKFYLQIFTFDPEYFELASFELTAAYGANNAFYYENLSSLNKSVTGLSGGTDYYWIVCAYYDDGKKSGVFDHEDRVVKYSQVFHFKTKGGAAAAYPSWPIGGNTIYNLEPTLYWYTMDYDAASTFTAIYSKDGNTDGNGVLDTDTTRVPVGTSTFASVAAELDASTDYYWQVETKYGTEYAYSSVAEFTTYDAPGVVATPANLSYPTGGLLIYTTAPTFYWYIEGYNSGSINFTVELTVDGTWGNADDITFGTTTNTYIQGSGLDAGVDYTWRVLADDGSNQVYSSEAEFSTAGGLNSYPVASWPVGNPTVYSATPTLSWYMEGSTLGWTHYKVGWSKENLTPAQWETRIEGAVHPDSMYTTGDMNETFYTFTSDLDYGATYYWAVTAHDHPTGPYSDYAFGSFTVAGNNASIVQLNPSNNTTVNTQTPQFTWWVNGSLLGVTHYRVTYSNTELFTANVETVVSTSTSADVNSSLDEGSTYWWYVELSYDGGSTFENASSTWSFSVDAGASAVMPLVGSPANGVTISDNNPLLSWYLPTQSESALSYEVELANNAEFNDAAVYSDISDLRAEVSELEQGEYYWRVKSTTGSSTSSYSNIGNFKVGDGVTSVDDEEELPLTYSIGQNYPNPFNPTTTINYSIPEANYVSIKIYNMLGQEVRTLLNQEVKAGRHKVEWRGENNYGQKVASGTYIYRISAGEFVQAKKMILLK